RDYPCGMRGGGEPGGRLVALESTKGDGRFDSASVLVSGLPFPTGLLRWRDGVFVCAAPDILRVADPARAGGALPTAVFSGFYTENFQARVNSLSTGLDRWIYGANGLFGGRIHGRAAGVEVDISGRDFRFEPSTGRFEPESGLTQQGRSRDDFG